MKARFNGGGTAKRLLLRHHARRGQMKQEKGNAMNAKLIALTTLAVTAAASSYARGPQNRPVRPDPQTVVI